MEPKKRAGKKQEGAPQASPSVDVYVHDTPRWRRYYQEVRKSIRFPRYYNKAVNW